MKRWTQAMTLMMAAALCFCLAACGAGGKDATLADEMTVPAERYSAEENGIAAMADKAEAAGGTVRYNDAGSIYQRSDVKLIRRAWLSVQSTDFDNSLAALNKLVSQFDGYFENSELYTGGYYAAQSDCRTGQYVVRIPAGSYDSFMAALDGIGTVTHRNESSEDVGQRYYDLESRLKTQRIKQERLQALLEKADRMEDIISLETALSDVEYMIESYSSDLRRYDGLIDFATVTVSLEEVMRVSVAPGERQPLIERLGAGIASSAQDFVDGLQEMLIWFSYHMIGLLFTAALIAACVILIRRAVRKGKKSAGKAPAKTLETAEGEQADSKA